MCHLSEEEKKDKVEENEKKFQEAFDKGDWDTMWMCVLFACKNICKSKANGIVINDLDEKALDATIRVMEKIKTGFRPDKLSSTVYLYCIGRLYDKKNIRWERSSSFEESFENYAFITDEENFQHLCKAEY